mmetsp:Transcript_55698/g.155230  ORF Transcript_55698/g.155230 Transcript_55698/m.155230 type:complete len:211 (+) Transcript_55698:701-1333(+)
MFQRPRHRHKWLTRNTSTDPQRWWPRTSCRMAPRSCAGSYCRTRRCRCCSAASAAMECRRLTQDGELHSFVVITRPLRQALHLQVGQVFVSPRDTASSWQIQPTGNRRNGRMESVFSPLEPTVPDQKSTPMSMHFCTSSKRMKAAIAVPTWRSQRAFVLQTKTWRSWAAMTSTKTQPPSAVVSSKGVHFCFQRSLRSCTTRWWTPSGSMK